MPKSIDEMKKYLFLIVPVVIIVLLTIPITNAHLKEVEEIP